jgi:hypothetical protein
MQTFDKDTYLSGVACTGSTSRHAIELHIGERPLGGAADASPPRATCCRPCTGPRSKNWPTPPLVCWNGMSPPGRCVCGWSGRPPTGLVPTHRPSVTTTRRGASAPRRRVLPPATQTYEGPGPWRPMRHTVHREALDPARADIRAHGRLGAVHRTGTYRLRLTGSAAGSTACGRARPCRPAGLVRLRRPWRRLSRRRRHLAGGRTGGRLHRDSPSRPFPHARHS